MPAHSHPTQKRLACERCRLLKLKCSLSSTGHDPGQQPVGSDSNVSSSRCGRCQRLDLRCAPGVQGRVGRPPRTGRAIGAAEAEADPATRWDDLDSPGMVEKTPRPGICSEAFPPPTPAAATTSSAAAAAAAAALDTFIGFEEGVFALTAGGIPPFPESPTKEFLNFSGFPHHELDFPSDTNTIGAAGTYDLLLPGSSPYSPFPFLATSPSSRIPVGPPPRRALVPYQHSSLRKLSRINIDVHAVYESLPRLSDDPGVNFFQLACEAEFVVQGASLYECALRWTQDFTEELVVIERNMRRGALAAEERDEFGSPGDTAGVVATDSHSGDATLLPAPPTPTPLPPSVTRSSSQSRYARLAREEGDGYYNERNVLNSPPMTTAAALLESAPAGVPPQIQAPPPPPPPATRGGPFLDPPLVLTVVSCAHQLLDLWRLLLSKLHRRLTDPELLRTPFTRFNNIKIGGFEVADWRMQGVIFLALTRSLLQKMYRLLGIRVDASSSCALPNSSRGHGSCGTGVLDARYMELILGPDADGQGRLPPILLGMLDAMDYQLAAFQNA